MVYLLFSLNYHIYKVVIQDKEIFNYNITSASVFASSYSFEFLGKYIYIYLNIQSKFTGVISKSREKEYKENPNLPKIDLFTDSIKPEGKKKIYEFYMNYCDMLKDNLKYSYEVYKY